MSLPRASVLSNISSLIEQINGPAEKQATELGLSGEGKQDPGGWKGPSTHPSARAASNVQKTPIGSRAKENESDAKKDWPIGVDSTSPGSGGSQDDKQMNLGTEQSSTGEDPKVEDHYKGDKDDKREGDRGGTSGPFDAERIGEKYSSMKFPEITKLAYAKLNKVLSNIAEKSWEKDASFGDLNGIPGPKKPIPAAPQGAMPGAAPAHTPAGPADQKSHLSTHPTPPKTAAAAGYALADLTKQAAVQEILARTIHDAELNAQLTYDILTKYAAHCDQLYKRAEDAPMPGAMGAADDGSSGAGPGGGPPPGMDAGGPPPGADAGGPPPGAGGPDGGAGGGAPAGQVDEIISALLQMGATPEEVMHSLQNATGGGAGGPPGGDAGGPPPGADAGGPPGMPPGGDKAGSARFSPAVQRARQELYQYCKVASERFRSGQWVPKPVKEGTKEAETRQQIQSYILEVVNAGR